MKSIRLAMKVRLFGCFLRNHYSLIRKTEYRLVINPKEFWITTVSIIFAVRRDVV